MITINRLYIENYKLFSQKEIDFSGALLSVFDGPNGYGKTSIFDAIELLITGKISRIKECESIDGKTGYKTIFFAQNSEKDVIFKAEFEDEAADNSQTDMEGMNFVVTGSVEYFSNRNAVKAVIEARGGKVTGSVTSKTSYLINNDIMSNSSKNKKAKELGVTIITEKEFIDKFDIEI